MNTSPLKLLLRFVQGMAVGIIFFGGCALSAHAEEYLPRASGGPVIRPTSLPEPSEFFVLLAGAGAVVAVIRRRRK
jgi:hypothetical protein